MRRQLILASTSPRRQAILAEAELEFITRPADVDERHFPGETPAAHVRRLAQAKAEAIATQYPAALVVGADTVVVLDGIIFGKPASLSEARQTLARFAGKTHKVLTGVCLRSLAPPHLAVWVAATKVSFRKLSTETIQCYCDTVNTLDKAGSYGLQDHGNMLIKSIEGLASNVIGLPIEELLPRLEGLLE